MKVFIDHGKKSKLNIIFKYDPDTVENIKKVAGASFDGETKQWTIPVLSFPALKYFLKDTEIEFVNGIANQGFNIPKSFEDLANHPWKKSIGKIIHIDSKEVESDMPVAYEIKGQQYVWSDPNSFTDIKCFTTRSLKLRVNGDGDLFNWLKAISHPVTYGGKAWFVSKFKRTFKVDGKVVGNSGWQNEDLLFEYLTMTNSIIGFNNFE